MFSPEGTFSMGFCIRTRYTRRPEETKSRPHSGQVNAAFCCSIKAASPVPHHLLSQSGLSCQEAVVFVE